MKFLFNVILIFSLAITTLNAQENKTEKKLSEEEARALREKQPRLQKSTTSQGQTSKTTIIEKKETNNNTIQKSNSVSKSNQHRTNTLSPERQAQLDKKSTNTTGIDYSKMSNHTLKGEDYQAAKKARLEKEQSTSSQTKTLKQIKESDYNKLPAEKQQHIKSNPNLYQIVKG